MPWRSYLAVAALVIAVQATQLHLLAGDVSVAGPIIDAQDFHREAMRIASGQPAPHTPHFHPPLFAWLLSVVYRVSGSNPAHGLFLQALLSLVIALEVLALARTWLGTRAALIAGIAAALYGPLLFFDAQLLATPLEVATALGALVLAARGSPAWSIGLLAGVAIAARGTIAPFVLYLVIVQRGFTRRLALCSGVLAGLLPVALSNAWRTGHFSFGTVNAGVNLWIGNNPDIRATTALRPGHAWDHMFSEPARHGAIALADQSAWFVGQALLWMVHHPIDALAGIAMKMGDLLNGLEVPRNLDPYGSLAHTLVTHALLWEIPFLRFPFGLVLPLAVLGLAANWSKPSARMIAAFAALNAAGICLFFPCDRYRLPIELSLLVPAIAGAIALGERKYGSRAAVAAVLVALWANVAPQLTGPNIGADLPMQLALISDSAGHWSDAQHQLETMLARRPDDADALRLLGEVRDQLGDHDGAAVALEQATSLAPDYAHAWQHLGAIRLFQHRPGDAVTTLEAAVREDPAEPYAWVELTHACLETGDLPEAIRAGREAVRVSPDHPDSRRFLATALRRSGDVTSAEDVLRQASLPR